MSELTWQKGYEELPPPKKEEVDGWVGTNMFLAAELGITPQEWWNYVEHAFQHPDDLGYLKKVEAFSSKDALDDEVTNPRQLAQKLGGPRKDLASIPKVGEKKPEGAISVSLLNFPRRG